MLPETSAPSLACPAAIEFLLHCHYRSGDPFERIHAPLYQSLVPAWLNLGIIEPCAAYDWTQASVRKNCYALTDLGRKHLEAIEALPFPRKSVPFSPIFDFDPRPECPSLEDRVSKIEQRENALARLFSELTEVELQRNARASTLRAAPFRRSRRISPFSGRQIVSLCRPLMKDDPVYRALVQRWEGITRAIRRIRSEPLTSP